MSRQGAWPSSVALVATLAITGGATWAAENETPQPSQAAVGSGLTVDWPVVRWHSRETGGMAKPQFILARELAFEARIEAMAEGLSPTGPYEDKHVRQAIKRHITETMLAHLPIEPAPPAEERARQIGNYAEEARAIIEQRVGTKKRLGQAANAEGIVSDEIDKLLLRQARASWYLDRMVAPMLAPSEFDLREVHKKGSTPYTDDPFEEVETELARWLIATRLGTQLERRFRNARSRLTITLISAYDPSSR